MAKSKIPGVLAMEKKLVFSDAYMYGARWEERHSLCTPLKLQEKSVRGTISNRLKKALKDDPTKLDHEVEKPNLQTVDSCALPMDQDTLKLTFTLKVLSSVHQPSACNDNDFLHSYQKAVGRYIEEEQFQELGKRFATNIANGRFFWRNRVGAEDIEIHVLREDQEKQEWIFNAKSIPLGGFDYEDNQLKSLSEVTSQALSGKIPFALLKIQAFAQVGSGQEVYPSEELVMDKGHSKSKKSKILYQVKEIAAMHSQKIGNAIRTIDTWYPDFSQVSTGPIAIEPYGAVTNLGVAYRNPKNKSDFYTLFDKFALGETLPNKEDEHYVMAVLVRGGVFGESGKE